LMVKLRKNCWRKLSLCIEDSRRLWWTSSIHWPYHQFCRTLRQEWTNTWSYCKLTSSFNKFWFLLRSSIR
jgi:hypothetical protein